MSTMGTKAVEDIRGATAALVERFHKLPDELISLSGATESRDLTSEQKLLLGALGLVLQFWPDRKTAETVEVNFGLRDTLERLKAGQSIILTGDSPHELQVQIAPLSERPKKTVPFASTWCPYPPPGHRCIQISRTHDEPPKPDARS